MSGASPTRARQSSGIDLGRYTILDVIDDLDAVRAALGRLETSVLQEDPYVFGP